MTGSNLKRKEYGTVMSSEANVNGLELPNEITWMAALQNCFDETVRTSSSLMTYLAKHSLRTDLQVRLVWFLTGMRKLVYEATIETKARGKELKMMGAFIMLIARAIPR